MTHKTTIPQYTITLSKQFSFFFCRRRSSSYQIGLRLSYTWVQPCTVDGSEISGCGMCVGFEIATWKLTLQMCCSKLRLHGGGVAILKHLNRVVQLVIIHSSFILIYSSYSEFTIDWTCKGLQIIQIIRRIPGVTLIWWEHILASWAFQKRDTHSIWWQCFILLPEGPTNQLWSNLLGCRHIYQCLSKQWSKREEEVERN